MADVLSEIMACEPGELLIGTCPPSGFGTPLGRIAPFYSRGDGYVMVGQKWLTIMEARRTASALLKVAHALGNRKPGTRAPLP